MNILTDVLSLLRRGKFAESAQLDDVLVLGVSEKPDMTGVASPIPYKSVKVIKVRDLNVAAEHCQHQNSPTTPAAGTGQIYQKTESDDVAGRTKVYEAIVRGDDAFEAGIPESFNVLVKEIRSLGLNVELKSSDLANESSNNNLSDMSSE